jgi:sarcosine oxidase
MGRSQYDVIVVGVGGMGSAACYHLAARGLSVLGIDRFSIPNTLGSSHGGSRIIRLAYYEHPSYVPPLRRAYRLWRELEQSSGRRLLLMTGVINAGPEEGRVFAGALRSSREHGLRHEVLSAAAASRRWPALRLPPAALLLVEPEGGILLPELCVSAHAEAARAAGAVILQGVPVLGWQPAGEGVEVRTGTSVHRANRLVITAGPWNSDLLGPAFAGLLQPERQVVAWLRPSRPEWFAFGRLPVWIVEAEAGEFYGFPMHGIPGFKLGRFGHRRENVHPDTMNRSIEPEDEEVLRAFAARYFPAADGPAAHLETCLFTNTPDHHFLVDRHPDHSQVVIAGGFSGHGFKFCSVLGEIVADLVTDQDPSFDLSLFAVNRFLVGRSLDHP